MTAVVRLRAQPECRLIASRCLAFGLVALLLGPAAPLVTAQTGALRARGAPTVAEARRFVDSAEALLAVLNVERNQAEWVNNTYITEDTEAITARAKAGYGCTTVESGGSGPGGGKGGGDHPTTVSRTPSTAVDGRASVWVPSAPPEGGSLPGAQIASGS